MSLAGPWEDHADEWIAWARTSAHDGFWNGTWPALREMLSQPGTGPVIDPSMHRPLSAYTSALFANGMAITALTEGGGGTVPWLLALRADKLPRSEERFPASRSRSRGRT